MSELSASFKRLFLRKIYWDVEANKYESLEAGLKFVASAKVENGSDGLRLTGTSANGASVSYQFQQGAASATATMELCSELVEKFYHFRGRLGEDAGDEAILGAMLGSIKGYTRIAQDFRGLRL